MTWVVLVMKEDGPKVCIRCSGLEVDVQSLTEAPALVLLVAAVRCVHFDIVESNITHE